MKKVAHYSYERNCFPDGVIMEDMEKVKSGCRLRDKLKFKCNSLQSMQHKYNEKKMLIILDNVDYLLTHIADEFYDALNSIITNTRNLKFMISTNLNVNIDNRLKGIYVSIILDVLNQTDTKKMMFFYA